MASVATARSPISIASSDSPSSTECFLLRSISARKLGRSLGWQDFACQLQILDGDGRPVHERLLPSRRRTRNPEWELNARFDVEPGYALQLKFLDENRAGAEVGSVVVRVELFRFSRSALSVPLVPRGRVLLSAHLIASPSESSNSSDGQILPQGWERREDANGRTFYVDHNRHRTQWQPPVGGVEGEAEEAEEAEEDSRRQASYAQRSRAAANSVCNVQDAIEAIDDAMRANFDGEMAGQTGEDDERPLPTGWTSQVAPNGRVFYVDHSTRRTTWEDPRLAAAVSAGSSDGLGPLPDGWEQRSSADGKIFFVDHAHKRTQWEDPRFATAAAAGPPTPFSSDYKRKVEYFRSKLPKASSGKCELTVQRASIFEDSYRQIMAKEPEQLKQKLWIELVGENALDYGGVSREWCLLLSRHCFNPYYGLFEYSATDTYTLQINAHSEMCNQEHLSYFHFIGRVIGMAIYHGKLLDAFFIRPFYKMMLGQPLSLADMESVDSAFYQSLLFVQQNDPADLDLTFSFDEDAFGKMEHVELKPGGAEITVTEENKAEYIEAVVQWRFSQRIQKQMEAVLRGVYELVPPTLLRLFDASQLELLMCGLQAIDVNDWRLNTQYKGGYGPNHPVVYNFWRCMAALDNEKRARVLQFVTGTSRVPMNGFAELYGSSGPQKFTLEKWGDDHALPRAHTCFNRLDLPPYKTLDDLKKKLLVAIENSEIFAGVD